ncbi:protein phosphatase 1 regulatory subunit 3B-like [Notothenia coriiceps]|uniref:Protein phosphatase 1 regulatory subunit 3B-like n=1 Tax=Notothenia coriiceps TaxID=8208 RepID=A0A6I9PQJ6_9TELE|nr:PREDICTED: protein phosphatase 1 regulatory subunit 3B-like [Notothenia coriiceps]
MPVDIMPLFLSPSSSSSSEEDFLYISSSEPREASPEEPSCRKESGKKKKQVTFADHRGLALTRVKVFCPLSDVRIPRRVRKRLSSSLKDLQDSLVLDLQDSLDSQDSLVLDSQDLKNSLRVRQSFSSSPQDSLVLDFDPPALDYLSFRRRLDSDQVCLYHCVLDGGVLSGSVRVRNVCFQKAVKLRLSMDGWRSHRDLDCDFERDSYPSSGSDSFSFSFLLPPRLQTGEFAVCFQTGGGQEFWDSNQGQNYHIVLASKKTRCPDNASGFGVHFDRYGSPSCSHGILPDWPSYARYENTGPYY